MLRAVRSTFLPLFKAQTQSIGCLHQNVKTHTNINAIRLCSTKFNPQAWIDTLDEAQQKRIRHIQNEVRKRIFIAIYVLCVDILMFIQIEISDRINAAAK